MTFYPCWQKAVLSNTTIIETIMPQKTGTAKIALEKDAISDTATNTRSNPAYRNSRLESKEQYRKPVLTSLGCVATICEGDKS